MILPTVKIDDNKGGYIVINKSDFDEKKHKLYSDKKEAAKEVKKVKRSKK